MSMEIAKVLATSIWWHSITHALSDRSSSFRSGRDPFIMLKEWENSSLLAHLWECRAILAELGYFLVSYLFMCSINYLLVETLL